MQPRQSQPSVSELALLPSPSSPASNAFLRTLGGVGSPYGTTISVKAARQMIGRVSTVLVSGSTRV